jgi:hypothetical protein
MHPIGVACGAVPLRKFLGKLVAVGIVMAHLTLLGGTHKLPHVTCLVHEMATNTGCGLVSASERVNAGMLLLPEHCRSEAVLLVAVATILILPLELPAMGTLMATLAGACTSKVARSRRIGVALREGKLWNMAQFTVHIRVGSHQVKAGQCVQLLGHGRKGGCPLRFVAAMATITLVGESRHVR